MGTREPIGNVSPVAPAPEGIVWGRGSTHLDESDDDSVGQSEQAIVRPELHILRWLRVYVSTVLRLGIANVVRAAIYGFCKWAGIYRWLLPSRKAVTLRFSSGLSGDAIRPPPPEADRLVLAEANDLLTGTVNYFSIHTHEVGNPPNWFLNPFRNKRHPQPELHWSDIPPFSRDVGDIKTFWEISRFTWAPVFARAWRMSGDARYLSTLQLWIQDWWQNNPPNTGPNWMCGQETSIRLINALIALRIAGMEENTESGLVAFVDVHCQRINVTTLYAVAQDNNHVISEAAGLFVGGTWLARSEGGDVRRRGRRWAQKGRRLLESRVCRLVLPDGSFSQHSLTYHRMMLDTLSIAEVWRRHLGEAPFSEDFYKRAAAATRWLGEVIDPTTGDGPNLGANDGAYPYRLAVSAYRDFRPCLQLASLLFLDGPAMEAGPWDESAAWLGIAAKGSGRPWLNDLSSAVFPDGGYVLMRNRTGARVLLRAPATRFRPVHPDALHLDLWWKGKNILRDGGTYSYADGGVVAEALASVIGHNVEQFDGRDQMVRLGRFLYGEWVHVVGLPAITTSEEGQSWAGSYTDIWGARHKRTVTLRADSLFVLDEVEGYKRNAVLRWRLAPGVWSQNETGCASALARIRVESDVPVRRIGLADGWESRHYLEKSAVPVLEVEIERSPAVLRTTITLS